MSKVGVSEDNIELNYWRKKIRERTTPIVAFDYDFSNAGKRRHVSISDLSKQQVWSNGSDML